MVCFVPQASTVTTVGPSRDKMSSTVVNCKVCVRLPYHISEMPGQGDVPQPMLRLPNILSTALH